MTTHNVRITTTTTMAASNSNMTVKEEAEQWISWDSEVDAGRAKELQALLDGGDMEGVEAAMRPRISFGTSGLRGKRAAGAHNMNALVVLQTAQGLAAYMRECGMVGENKPGCVVIAYDGRHESEVYAKTAASVFLGAGMRVLLPSDTMATPFVPYALAHPLSNYPAPDIGIVVTASHNPAPDNGFKVYWANGAAIIPPHSDNIAAAILDNLVPAVADNVPLADVRDHPACDDVYAPLMAAYTGAAVSAIAKPVSPLSPPIVYTAMHGVGTRFVKAVFEGAGEAQVLVVPQQEHPDPDFPTVTFPNPEEGKGALALAMALADEKGADLILANDPDADRLAVAERDADGEWYVFNGNELGLLFAARAWDLLDDAAKETPENNVFINTAVSSSALEAFAKSVGARHEATLTGFKYMGNKAIDEIEAGNNFVFAYEEAIGFMIGSVAFDKDGIQTSLFAAQYWRELASSAGGVTRGLFRTAIEGLYAKIGYFHIQTRYFFCYDPSVMASIFDAVRANQDYKMSEFAAAGHPVARVRDQTTGYDSGESDGKTRLPVTPNGQMITFWFESGATATIRGSGTEPKLKRYVEVSGDVGDKGAVVAAQKELDDLVISVLLKPEENGLVAQKTE